MASTISFGDKNNGLQAGIINGVVEFHLPPERPETPPRPSIMIPFPRDADFVERGTTLDHLHQLCAVPGLRAALVGLGGVGKSQLAIEYAYHTRERSQETWVFWVHASNAARFEQSYRDIADYLKMVGRQNSRVNIFKLVHDWLRDSKDPWLLILDNADDARFLLHVPANGEGQPTDGSRTASRPLREYLPHCERGSIIVTTRNMDAALKLVEQRDIIAVEPMDETQAQALFKKKLRVQEDDSDIAELAAALEYMPLAIVQAAAYISEKAPRCSVVKYLDEFKRSERKRTSLLNYDKGQLRRDWEAKSSIIVTWQISFEHILQTRPSAADLLSLMSFFDRQGIPEGVLRSRAVQRGAQLNRQDRTEEDTDSYDEDDMSQSSTSEDEFEEDVAALRNFYLVSANIDRTSFEMHALVQLATRKWLNSNGKLEQWRHHFISNLCAAFPTGQYENWAACQVLFAHAKSAIVQRPEEESSLAEWATLLYRAAWYAKGIGNITDAKEFALKSMKARSRALGQEHEDTLWSKEMVGLAYELGGQWDVAEKSFLQVVETRKKKLGADHPDTLMSMANLALTYRNQGRWDTAKELFVQVIETSKKKLGADHLDTLTSMANLASTYRYQGRWDAAEELFVQVMETSKKLGADHPFTLTSMANLALTYRIQGRWDVAEELFVQVMETSKKKLGADHPSTLTRMANLAATYRNQGRWDTAEELDMQVLETRKKKLGADHPSTLTSMASLALTYWNQGRWDAAEELEVQVMEMSKEKLGADHPDTLTSMGNLALTYKNQGRWDAVEELEVQVMEMSKEKLGADHPDTLTSMNNLAITWKEQGKAAEALCLLTECVRLCQHVFKPDHPTLRSFLATLEQWEAEHLDVT
jgi:tetratricopeptide (TPR) repeat protein